MASKNMENKWQFNGKEKKKDACAVHTTTGCMGLQKSSVFRPLSNFSNFYVVVGVVVAVVVVVAVLAVLAYMKRLLIRLVYISVCV